MDSAVVTDSKMHLTGFFSIQEGKFHLFYFSSIFNLENETICAKAVCLEKKKSSCITKFLAPSVFIIS